MCRPPVKHVVNQSVTCDIWTLEKVESLSTAADTGLPKPATDKLSTIFGEVAASFKVCRDWPLATRPCERSGDSAITVTGPAALRFVTRGVLRRFPKLSSMWTMATP